jgi:hypothetical protein
MLNSLRPFLNILAQTKATIFFLSKKLPAIKKPLVTKNKSTAIDPYIIPIASLSGSASPDPIASAKLWVYKTAVAAIKRIRLKLLSLFSVWVDSKSD